MATFKAYYLLRTFRKLINETHGESSIKHFWKNYNIKDVDNISESWKKLKSSTMNHVWKIIWPESIKTEDSEVDSLSEIRKTILNLANDLGFEVLEEVDVLDILNADREPLLHEEQVQFEEERALDEEPANLKELVQCAVSFRTRNKHPSSKKSRCRT